MKQVKRKKKSPFYDIHLFISSLKKNYSHLHCLGDLRRAHLLRHLTTSWATQYTTTLITMVLSSAPYTNTSSFQRERFLRAFTKEWDFSKLSEFFMYLQSPANIDYKVKCVMLQEAARRERETLGAKLRKKRVVTQEETNTTHSFHNIPSVTVTPTTNDISHGNSEVHQEEDTMMDASSSSSSAASSSSTTGRRHHRRTSSNDVNDIKRLRLSTPDLDHGDTNNGDVVNFSLSNTTASSSSASALSQTSINTNTRRSASPDHHHHHPLRCVTTNTTGMSSELSHLHLTGSSGPTTTTATSTTTNTTTTSSTRRRSSSIISNESLDDPMETDTINKKKTSGPSSINNHFATTTEE